MMKQIKSYIADIDKEIAALKAKRDAALMPKDPADVVLADVSGHPGAARREIAQRTGLTPRAITNAVGELKRERRLFAVGERIHTRWFERGTLEQLIRQAA